MGSRKKQTVGHEYFFGLHHGVCRGSADELLAIEVGDRLAWEGSVTDNATISIAEPNLFGGHDREGGIVCDVDVMFGAETQPLNARLAAMLPGLVSAFRGVTTLFSDGIMCVGPYPKPWRHKWRRTHRGWDGPTWYPEKARIMLSGPGGEPIAAANPAHILYQCFINRDWGRGLARARLDDTAWRAAADTLYAEGFGLCMSWLRQEGISDFMAIVRDHIGAAFYPDPSTGLITIRLIRDDYDPDTLPLFDADTGLLEVQDDDSGSQDTAVNEVIVNYTSPVDGKPRQVRVKNSAAINALGAVSSDTKDYPGLPTAELALRVAQRDLRLASGFIKRFKVRLDRRAYWLMPGTPFRIRDLKRGIQNVVLRAARVEHAELGDGSLTVTALQDVFGLPAASFVVPQPSAYNAPSLDPVPVTGGRLLEVPYRDLAATMDAARLAALATADVLVGAVGPAPTPLTYGFDMRLRIGATGAFSSEAEGSCCPSAVLAADIAPGATLATLSGGINLSRVAVNTAVLIGDEICRVDAIDTGAMTVTLGRGCADTVPAGHAAGTAVLFYDGYNAAGETEFATGVTLNGKLVTQAPAGELAESAAPTLVLTLAGRQGRPYAPARLRINGAAYPTAVAGNPIGLSWAHRDRLLQLDQLIDTLATSIGPEPGTTYSLEIRHGVTDALIAQASGLAVTSYTAPDIGVSIPVRVQLWAVRDGVLQSTQRHDWTFDFDASVFAAEINLASAFATLRALALPVSGQSTVVEGWRFLLPDGDFVTIEDRQTWGGAVHTKTATITRWNGATRSVRHSATLGTECTGADYDAATNLLIVARNSSGATQGWILDMDAALTDAQPTLAGSLLLVPSFFGESAGTLPFAVAIDGTSAYLKVLDPAFAKIRRIDTATGAEISAITSSSVDYGDTLDFDADATSLVHFDVGNQVVVRDVVTMAESARWALPAAPAGRATLIDGEVVVVAGGSLRRYSKAGALLGTHGGVIHQNAQSGTGPQKFGRYLSAGADPITVYDTLDGYAVVPDIYYTPP